MRVTSGFVCPECGARDRQSIVGWIYNRMRLLCLACEHAWTVTT